MTSEIFYGFNQGFFIFINSFLFALIEIEIEGKEGWAKNLPTVRNIIGKMTLYHVYMFLFIITIFLRIYPLNGINSFDTIFYTTSWFLLEDFLWFILNPYYTIKNYKKNAIWWHSDQKWLFGMPLHNYTGLILMLICTYFKQNKLELFISSGTMAISFLFTMYLSPIYHKFYNKRLDKIYDKLTS